jgi:hypothetical protein
MVTARIIIVQINHVRVCVLKEFIKQIIHELLIRLLSHNSSSFGNHDVPRTSNKMTLQRL